MIVSVHQPQYIPWLGFFDKITKSDYFVFLDNVQYKEREYQNRNKIRTQMGSIWLSVPVISKGQGRQVIRDVLIDNEVDWRKQHLRSLETWYAKAEYFKVYHKFFQETYSKDWEKLSELNINIISFFLKELGINTKIVFETALGISSAKTDRIVDICNKLNADTYLSGAGGRDYLEEGKFTASGIKLLYQDFSHPKYRQQFMANDEDFIPYLSTVDLLFNEGHKSIEILKLGN
jgi:hypothetical protein